MYIDIDIFCTYTYISLVNHNLVVVSKKNKKMYNLNTQSVFNKI